MSIIRTSRRHRRTGLIAAVASSLLAAPLALATPASADEPDHGDPWITTAATTWHYLDDNTEPQGDDPNVLAWTAPGFDDSGWATGLGSFGSLRGEPGPLSGGYVANTVTNHYIDGTSNPTIPAYFFRYSFELDAAAVDRVLELAGEVIFDDAVRIYLNGELIYNDRDERADDPTRNLQYAGTSGGSPVVRAFDTAPDALVAGTNTVAVILYQDRATSSDEYFDFVHLTPLLAPAPAPTDDQQEIEVTVPEPGTGPGEFLWTIDGSNDLVDLGTAELAGDRFEASGGINPVRVTDTRTGGPAWSVSGQVGDFVADGQTVDGKYLGWAPAVTENDGGAVPGDPVASGFLGGDGLAESATLGSAPVGHALGSSLLAADLELLLPVTVSEGTYRATLTLTALS